MEKKEVLLKFARAAIAEALGIAYPVKPETLRHAHPWLNEPGAAFVTLNRKADGALRGCIGSIVAHRSLYDDIVHNAKAAALNDPRFPSMTPEEFERVKVEVSLLTPPKPLPYGSVEELKRKIRPSIDGVILRLENYQATYLPQVWEQLPDFDSFFATLCQKAGLRGDCLRQHPEIFVYQVESFEEEPSS